MKGFRPSRPASTATNVTKTLASTAVFWTAFLFVLPELIEAAETALGLPGFVPQRPTGVVLFAVAGTLGLTSGIWMAVHGKGTPLPLDTARELVVSGPYRWVRNPMAVAGIAQGVAVGLYRGSFTVVGYSLAGAVIWHVLVRPHEERDLHRRFGGRYDHYREQVRCWWPRLEPYSD